MSLFTAAVASAFGATGPDLTVTRSSNTQVWSSAYTVVSLTVSNLGNAPAPSVNFTYSPGTPSVLPLTGSYTYSAILKGHSGRDGGYTRVGWYGTQTAGVPLAPGATRVVKVYVVYPLGTFNETWAVDTGTVPQLNLVSHGTGNTVLARIAPLPSAPTAVAVSQTGDSLNVTWKVPAVSSAMTSSTVTAVPTTGSGAATLSAVVAGPHAGLSLPGVEPLTAYSVTVQSTDSGGTGPASAPVSFMTHQSTVVPDAPVIGHIWWIGTSLAVSWPTPAVGDSPIDDYEVSVTDSDSVNTLSDSGVSTEDVIGNIDPYQDYLTVIVRAHNAAGWSKWSAPVQQGGL